MHGFSLPTFRVILSIVICFRTFREETSRKCQCACVFQTGITCLINENLRGEMVLGVRSLLCNRGVGHACGPGSRDTDVKFQAFVHVCASQVLTAVHCSDCFLFSNLIFCGSTMRPSLPCAPGTRRSSPLTLWAMVIKSDLQSAIGFPHDGEQLTSCTCRWLELTVSFLCRNELVGDEDFRLSRYKIRS